MAAGDQMTAARRSALGILALRIAYGAAELKWTQTGFVSNYAAEETPRKGRARRGRKSGAAAEVSAPAETAVAEPEAPSAEVIDLSSAPEPEPEPPIVTVPEPVTAATPEPVAVVEAAAEPAPRPIDANEIVAPPATPKRGWWRRGA